jgi:cytochrome oxidase Cu insertion factor (SCO1/SenC/PrrC family)
MSRSIGMDWFAVVIVLLAAPAGWPQDHAQPAPAANTGLPIGARAPRFTLEDQHGRQRSLDEFLRNGKVALVFYRSADW